MPSLKQARQRRFLQLESLEGRRMMAGDVAGADNGPAVVGQPVVQDPAVPPIEIQAKPEGEAAKSSSLGTGSSLSADVRDTLATHRSGLSALRKVTEAELRLQKAQDKLEAAEKALEQDPAYKQLKDAIVAAEADLEIIHQQMDDTQAAIDDFERRAADNHVENPIDYQVRKFSDGSYQEVEIHKNPDGSIKAIITHPVQDPAGHLRELEQQRRQLTEHISDLVTEQNKMRDRKLARCVRQVQAAERRLERAVRIANATAARIKKEQDAKNDPDQDTQNPTPSEPVTPPPNAIESGMRVDIRNPFGNRDEVHALLKGIASQRRARSAAEKVFLDQVCNQHFTGLVAGLGETVSLMTALANPKSPVLAAKLGLKAFNFIKTWAADPSGSIHDVRTNFTGTSDNPFATTRITTIIKDGRFVVVAEMTVDANKTNTRQFKTGVVQSGTYRFVYEGQVIQ